MGKINWGRVILGGLLAGILINVGEFIINGLFLGEDWNSAMRALGIDLEAAMQTNPAMLVTFLVWGFIFGVFLVWFYAAIRPRFGAGPMTAVYAGAAVWLVAYLGPLMGYSAMGLWPMRLALIASALGLAEFVLATVLGAWPYKEA